MKERPPKSFSAVPYREDGQPLNLTRTKPEFEHYIAWLADYLYRRRPQMPASATLSLKQAWSFIIRIEIEIAAWIWEHPFDDYPPDDYQPRHADILHRPELSKILSRVVNHDERRKLLDRFYRELTMDALK